ncbi:hypothetical protein G6F36_004191 [Rhizopus arrhizus]|nr:hypothetical protein G6F36_004191 [Rhizopus arrhizus]
MLIKFVLFTAIILISFVCFVFCAPVKDKVNNSRLVSSSPSSRTFSGSGTFYMPGLGSCGWKNSEKEMIVALNHAQMSNGGNSNNNRICGKHVTINGPKGSVTAKVVDTCPGCSNGDIDMSPAAFKKIANLSQGRVSIKWSWS